MNEEKDDKVVVGLEKVLLRSERLERKNKIKRIILTIVLCVLFLVIGFATGSLFSYTIHPINKADVTNTFGEIEAILQNKWVYSSDYDDLQTELENKAFYGMTAFDDDPYTTYMSAQELGDFTTNINMDYVGIGVQYAMNNNTAIIQRVFVNSPAEQAGLLPGDIIEEVDHRSVDGLTSDEIKELVLGEDGTKVVITVIRDNTKIDFPVIRKPIDSSVYCYAQDDYVVMELSSFGNNTAQDCINYLDQYTDYEKIIIDLRSNTGGYQTSVKEIAGLFIGNDKVYLRQKDSKGNETSDKTSCTKTYTNFKKYVLLINQDTASAAEVLTICLKEQLPNVTLVGETTYGKGVIQTTEYLLNGGVLKYTSYNWYSPNGVSIHKKGIEPDIEVKLPDIAYDSYVEMGEDETYEIDSVSQITKICEEGLEYIGYKIDRKDGYFDEQLDATIRQYKADNNMEVNGIIDYETYESIVSNTVYLMSDISKDVQFNKAIELMSE